MCQGVTCIEFLRIQSGSVVSQPVDQSWREGAVGVFAAGIGLHPERREIHFGQNFQRYQWSQEDRSADHTGIEARDRCRGS